MPIFWRVLIINRCWILSKAFSASIEMIVWFLSFNLLIWCITLIDFCILKNPCIPGINPRRRQWKPTPILLPGKSHGWRSLVGCSPWGRWGSDTTERLHFRFSLSCIGEGNGNPLECSCLENPRDGGAWWAAVYGVAQSRTRLKWLSSSSSSTPNQKKVSAAILISEQISEQGKLSGIKRDIT